MNKLKMWNEFDTWHEAEKAWDQGAQEAKTQNPIKGLNRLPQMPGMTEDTAKNLKWKCLKWIIQKDHQYKILKSFLRHPFKYSFSLIKSMFNKKSYLREGDFFLYGLNNLEEFKTLLENTQSLFVVGFSYCHKPFECPSGRFTPDCIHDPNHSVCRQCFIGKTINALPEQNSIPLLIPTIHYIGEQIFSIVHSNPNKKVIFIITACEMTLEMFGDLGNMVGIKGIGVRLDGRICNTMKAFELSENGIKPGLTVVLQDTQDKILELIRFRRENII